MYYVIAGRRLKLGKNFKKMIPIYKHFAQPWEHCLDFSDDMLLEMYEHESCGKGTISKNNGFYQGKKWMTVTIAMWREDWGSTLHWSDLYDDPNLPHWWLDKIFGRLKGGRDVSELYRENDHESSDEAA